MPFYCTTQTDLASLDEVPFGTLYHHPDDESCAQGTQYPPMYTYIALGVRWNTDSDTVTCFRLYPKPSENRNYTAFGATICVVEWRAE